VSATLVAILAFAVCSCGGHPSDAQLTDRFKDKKADFETLARMFEVDTHLSRVAPKFTWLVTDVSWPRANIGLPAERWTEYRRLFDETGTKEGLLRPENSKIVYFIASAGGMVTGGSEKGYAFSNQPLQPILWSLDGKPPLESGIPGYKVLDPQWYLYYRWDH
jgi:hypothetical protein